MQQYCGVFQCLVVLITLVAGENVLDLKKLTQPRHISSKLFSEYTKGHIIINYYNNRVKEKAHLKNFHNLQYTVRVEVGTPGQKLDVIFDTGSADFMVMSKAHCGFPFNIISRPCRKLKTYDESKSFKFNKGENFLWEGANFPAFHVTYGESELQGYMMFDAVKIGDILIEKGLVGLIDEWKNSFSYSKADGILGIGPRKDSNFADGACISGATVRDLANIKRHQTFAEALRRKGTPWIGFHLYKDKRGNDAGSLILGEDNNVRRYKGQIEWFSPQTKGVLHWRFPFTRMRFVGMATGVVEGVIFSGNEPIPDPGTSLIAGPPKVIDVIHEYIFKDMQVPKRVNKFGTVEFDCRFLDQLPLIVFVTSKSQGYILEPRDYVRKLSNTCISGFMAIEKLPTLIIGDTFFQKYYVVFDNENFKIGLAESLPPPEKTKKKWM